MNEKENVTPTPESLWIRQNWPFLFGLVFAFLWLIIAVVHWWLLKSQDSTIESGNYQTFQRYLNTAGIISVAGIVLAVLLIIALVLKRETILNFGVARTDWHQKKVSDRVRMLLMVVTVSVLLFASALSCLAIVLYAFLSHDPTVTKTVNLNGYTYHLAQRPTSDWDSNEIILYECSRPYTNCHAIHEEFTVNPDRIDLHIDVETNTLSLMSYDSVVFEYHPALTNP
jgi:ABC-type multidrug transport system fused ATPase/permease subunit